MSIHVTVTSNPLCISRSKVLLTDVDQAKKNEWNRRRKLRLQQVRQQARDLASTLRKKCDAEVKQLREYETEESIQEFKLWQAKQLQKLQTLYDKGIADVGSGHRTANCQGEDDNNVKELKDALAKARGDLARERVKIKISQSQTKPTGNSFVKGRRDKSPKVDPNDDPFGRNKIKKIPSIIKSDNPKLFVSHVKKISSPVKKDKSIKIRINEKKPTECTIPSPGTTPQQKRQLNPPKSIKSIRRPRSYSPSRNTAELNEACTCESDDSDDSNATWPPLRARVLKTSIFPRKVRFYNHDERVSKEYIKSERGVTHIDAPYNHEMEKYIEEEEKAIVKKSELDAAVRKRNVIRAQQVLRNERLQREFKSMSRHFTEVDKRQRIARIFEFPYPGKDREDIRRKEHICAPPDPLPSTSKEPISDIRRGQDDSTERFLDGNIDKELQKCFEVGALLGSQKKGKKQEEPIHQNPFTLKNLIKDLEKERDLLLNSSLQKSIHELDHSVKKNAHSEVEKHSKTESCKKETITLENVSKGISQLVKENVTEETGTGRKKSPNKTENDILSYAGTKKIEKRPYPIEVNVITKPACDCCKVCSCQSKTEEEKLKHPAGISGGPKRSSLGQEKSSNEENKSANTNPRSHNENPQSVLVCERKNSSYENEIRSSSSSEQITITVKLEDNKSNGNELNIDQKFHESDEEEIAYKENKIPWCELLGGVKAGNSNSSSSYCSPPEKLSPKQKTILNSILLKMCVKNNNPELHKYVKRLLFMNKTNVDSLSVSSPSEVSVHSDIFSNISMDHVTGTYFLQDNKTKKSKQIRFVESESGKTSREKKKKDLLRKVVEINTSSEDSNIADRNFVLEECEKMDTPKLPTNLADEYSIRLNELINLLNLASPRILGSQCRDYDSSSYIYSIQDRSPLSEPSNYIVEYDKNRINDNERAEEGYKNNTSSEDQEISAYERNNIVSLGLPYELLPKPFTIKEDVPSFVPKPPISSNKFRVEGHLPHELSAIPEASSSHLGINEHLDISKNGGQESIEFNLDEYSPSDVDLLDISSIKDSSPRKISEDNKEIINEVSRICEELLPDTSSLSILSHMTNESLIDVESEVSQKEIGHFQESPSEYIEKVFKSLGVGWALSTLRKTRQARLRYTSASTTTTSNENSYIERKKQKSTSRVRTRNSHSTPRKTDPASSSSSTFSEEIQRKFSALKNDGLSLTPPDLSLKVPVLGTLDRNNVRYVSGSSSSRH